MASAGSLKLNFTNQGPRHQGLEWPRTGLTARLSGTGHGRLLPMIPISRRTTGMEIVDRRPASRSNWVGQSGGRRMSARDSASSANNGHPRRFGSARPVLDIQYANKTISHSVFVDPVKCHKPEYRSFESQRGTRCTARITMVTPSPTIGRKCATRLSALRSASTPRSQGGVFFYYPSRYHDPALSGFLSSPASAAPAQPV